MVVRIKHKPLRIEQTRHKTRTHNCPPGQHWVEGHHKKNTWGIGVHWVKGGCVKNGTNPELRVNEVTTSTEVNFLGLKREKTIHEVPLEDNEGSSPFKPKNDKDSDVKKEGK